VPVPDRPSLELERMPRVIAALGPKMLELARDRNDGAHPYLVTPDYTQVARSILGPEPWLCVEQKVLAETDPVRARHLARGFLANYVSKPNYLAAWRRQGFTDEDFLDGGSDRLVDAMVAWGDEDTIADRVERHLHAGATQVCVQAVPSASGPVATGPEWSTLEMVAERFGVAG
jgi:probable F420-dependent oxidoreductase